MSIHEEYDKVFKALASYIRRQILDTLRDQPMTTGAMCAMFEKIDRCTVMQHLKVLEDAGLVIAERRGRERWNHLNAMPIQDIHDRWIGPHAAAASAKLARFKQAVEAQ
ncbi:transcriptional regulator, ArsR family [Sphingopyxis sp. YR583]|jgi:DNA-binding transcriptional ArsR family regulator|uniref:ArsR/SmtB family transcription factor n=1 Tax=Sphingopyxis sp. YR583 TaxID=1881047 RepID=UPI0008A737BF|nr:metalloregulator ArsR/SmtB family transcription factor [Sphingopyxis sp. YR583]SEH14060.1 transcriptional regulator, ArsR family [Sphingopyxis sp. YR583]